MPTPIGLSFAERCAQSPRFTHPAARGDGEVCPEQRRRIYFSRASSLRSFWANWICVFQYWLGL